MRRSIDDFSGLHLGHASLARPTDFYLYDLLLSDVASRKMLSTMKANKRIEQRSMVNKQEDIVVRSNSNNNNNNDGDDYETNSRSSEGKCHVVDRRRRSLGSGHQRRIGLTKPFSSTRFLPLANDGDDYHKVEEKPPKTPIQEFALHSASTLTTIDTTPSTVTSTLFSSSKSREGSPKQKISPRFDRKKSEPPPPPLPPRRCRSGSCSAHRRRPSGSGSVTNVTNAPRSNPSNAEVANAAKIEALEDELDRLNGELALAEIAQEKVQQQKRQTEELHSQLEEEFEALQNDILHKLAQMETIESENDRLQEECVHYETQVFSMTKSLEACLTERDAKNEAYMLVHQQWDKMHQMGTELLQDLHDHHSSASSPDHVDLELHFRHQQEVLEEMQEEVRQLREEVKPYERRSSTTTGSSILIIPDPPQSRLFGTSPKRTFSLLPHPANSPGSKSSGSSKSPGGDGEDGTTKDRRKVAAQELRQDLQQRRQRRTSITTTESR